jgi:hypothetical protein
MRALPCRADGERIAPESRVRAAEAAAEEQRTTFG